MPARLATEHCLIVVEVLSTWSGGRDRVHKMSDYADVVVWVIAGPITGAIHGHFLPLLGVGAVAIFSTALFTTIFVRLLGMLAILPVIAVLMFLGVPASNGAMSIYMELEMFRILHDVLPMPAAVESVRSILYFDADMVGTHLTTFAIWGVISLVIVAVIDRFRPRGRSRWP